MSEEPEPKKGDRIADRLAVGDRGEVVMRSAQDAIDFARWCFDSGYLPEHIKNVQQAFAIAQRGAELGLPPFAAWRFIYPTKGGKLGIESKGALAVVQSKRTFGGYKEWIEGEGEEMRAVATAWRRGAENAVVTKEFTWEDATRAGLTKRPTGRSGQQYDGPWQSYIKDMLLSKARARCLDVAFAAELGGIPVDFVADEIDVRETHRAAQEAPRGFRRSLEAGREPRALPPGEAPPARFTEVIRGKDLQAAIHKAVPGSGPKQTIDVPAEPMEAFIEERMERTERSIEADAETFSTCQHKLSPVSICGQAVVPGTDRCSKHHFEEDEVPAAEAPPEPPSEPEAQRPVPKPPPPVAEDTTPATSQSPFARALRERNAKKWRDPEDDRTRGAGVNDGQASMFDEEG